MNAMPTPRWPMRWFSISIAGVMLTVLAIGLAFAALRLADDPLADLISLGTGGLVVVTILAIIYRRDGVQAASLGFALATVTYPLALWGFWVGPESTRKDFITTRALHALYPMLRAEPTATDDSHSNITGRLFVDPRDRRISRKLDQPVQSVFQTGSLEMALFDLAHATGAVNDPGLEFYVDPLGLEDAHCALDSTVTLRSGNDVPLRTALREMLKPLGLDFVVRNGVVVIDSHRYSRHATEAYLRVGHCLGAILAGCLGAIVGRVIYATRPRPRDGADDRPTPG